VDVVMIGDDLTGQNGPLFSPRFYRQVVKPRQKRLVQHIRGLTEAKVWYHTCGAAVEYIPDLLDNGVDILNPVQVSARGMEPARLKREFGEKIVFWGGGVDSQHVLPFATPEEVRAAACANVRTFLPGGGYVFNPVHNISRRAAENSWPVRRGVRVWVVRALVLACATAVVSDVCADFTHATNGPVARMQRT
jgi:uroporphyrinogen decarboxylase